jgi:hypothetical protein
MATTSCDGIIRLSVGQTLSSLPIPPALVQEFSQRFPLGQGTGAMQFNLIHVKKYSLAGSTQSIDLTSLADLSGATVNMARVRGKLLCSRATGSGYTFTEDTTVSNGFKGFSDASTGSKRRLYSTLSSTATTFNFDLVTDFYSVGAGIGAVTSGTSKVITLDPGANTFDVWAFILGCDAVS